MVTDENTGVDPSPDYLGLPKHAFSVDISEWLHEDAGPLFGEHWHEHLEFVYFTAGQALVHCNGKPLQAKAGDLVLINANELHYGENLCDHMACHVIRIDFSLLSDAADSCQIKYMAPLMHRRISFTNMIRDERVVGCIRRMIDEHRSRQMGFELAIRAAAYDSLAFLLRDHLDKSYSAKEQKQSLRNVLRFRQVSDFLDAHYAEKISLDRLAAVANMSKYHFCRLFSRLTGRSPGDYLNRLRIDKAVVLLKESDLNVTEIALACGFNDSNYFCRVFRKYRKVSPSRIRKS